MTENNVNAPFSNTMNMSEKEAIETETKGLHEQGIKSKDRVIYQWKMYNIILVLIVWVIRITRILLKLIQNLKNSIIDGRFSEYIDGFRGTIEGNGSDYKNINFIKNIWNL